MHLGIRLAGDMSDRRLEDTTEQEVRELIVRQHMSWLGSVQGDARHKEILRIYNEYRPLPRGYKMQPNDAWCQAFDSVPAIQLGWTDIIPPECSCWYAVEAYKKHPYSKWEECDDYKPQIGDKVMYDWKDGEDYATTDNKGSPSHVGTVCAVSGDDFDVIEGNYSKSVKIRRMKVNGRYIRGFCLPAYHLKAEPERPAPVPEEEDDDMAMSQDHFNQMFENALLAHKKKQAVLAPSDWSDKAREFAESDDVKLILGVNDDGDMQYQTYCTREMLVTILYRFYEYLKGETANE